MVSDMAGRPDLDDLIYDWNQPERGRPGLAGRGPGLRDGTLRAAMEGPAGCVPSVAERISFLADLPPFGVTAAELGSLKGEEDLPAVREILSWLKSSHSTLRPAFFLPARVEAVRRAQSVLDDGLGEEERGRRKVEVDLAPADGPRRTGDDPRGRTGEAVDLAVSAGFDVGVEIGLSAAIPSEDAVDPLRAALRMGPNRLVLSDLDGSGGPAGAGRLVGIACRLRDSEAPRTTVGWKGSNEHGTGVASALAAAAAGADVIYGTFLGIGDGGVEVSLDQVAVNLDLDGASACDLAGLVTTCERLAEAIEWALPANYPLVGRDAFRTGTGVHAAAIIKALDRSDDRLADRVYSGVTAGRFGKGQIIELGPMSGMSNVRFWLEQAAIPYDQGLATALLARAKASRRVLEPAEIEAVVADYRRKG